MCRILKFSSILEKQIKRSSRFTSIHNMLNMLVNQPFWPLQHIKQHELCIPFASKRDTGPSMVVAKGHPTTRAVQSHLKEHFVWMYGSFLKQAKRAYFHTLRKYILQQLCVTNWIKVTCKIHICLITNNDWQQECVCIIKLSYSK